MKKLLMVSLALCVIVLCFLSNAPSAQAAQQGGYVGEGLVWTLDEDGTLVISGNGAMDGAFTYPAPWSEFGESIKKAVIESGVTSIRDIAFMNCYNLTEVIIADTVRVIGFGAFANCESLTDIIIPESVTEIGTDAFSACISLTSIVIPPSISKINDYMFLSCYSLTDVAIPASVTEIGVSAFEYCESLKKITIPSCVTKIGDYAFRECISLESITIPDSVTILGEGMFTNCRSLESAAIGTGVRKIGNAFFKDCWNLSDITFSGNVTGIGQEAFYGCSSLTGISLPESVENIGDFAFYLCENLSDIHIPSGVTKISQYMFGACGSLKTVGVPESVAIVGEGAFSNCGKLSGISLPEGVTFIANSAFMNCYSLEDFRIPSGVTSIEHSTFSGCSSLKKFTVPDGVTSIGGYAFAMCYGLTQIDIPDSVTAIGDGAFYYCQNLTKIQIPYSVVSIGERAFASTGKLKSITVDKNNPYYCNDALGVLFDKKQTNLIGAPGAISGNYTIPDSVVSIATSAFDGCSNLTAVAIPKSVTSIGEYAFNNCYSLTSIRIPEGVTAIKESTFQHCSNLTEITLGSGVTEIGESAFAECGKLTAITIPDAVHSIGYGAFENCDDLREIRFQGDAPAIDPYAFGGVTATAYYPDNASWTEEMRQNYGGNITWVAVEVEKPAVEWVSASTTLGGNIGLNFYVKLADALVNDPTTFVRFTTAGRTMDVPLSEALESVKDGVVRYRFTCPLNAKNMTDEVVAQVMTADGAVGKTLSMNVAKYCNYMIQYGGNAKLADLMKAMLNYGAAAQVLFGYNTGNLANAALSEEDKVLAEVDASAYASKITGSEEGITIASATLMLETETSVRIYFKLTGDKTIDQYRFFVDNVAVQPIEKDGKFYVEIKDIAAQDLDARHTITVGGLTIEYSGLSYVNTVINYPASAGEALVNAAKAIFAYNRKAEAYFN